MKTSPTRAPRDRAQSQRERLDFRSGLCAVSAAAVGHAEDATCIQWQRYLIGMSNVVRFRALLTNTPPRPWELDGVVYADGLFVAVGKAAVSPFDRAPHDQVMTSSDGIWWDVRPLVAGTGLNGIAGGKRYLVAVGDAGRILRPGAALRAEPRAAVIGAALPLTINGELGRRYAIEASSNLTDWTVVGTCLSTNYTVHVLDPDAGQWTRRFYRAKELPLTAE